MRHRSSSNFNTFGTPANQCSQLSPILNAVRERHTSALTTEQPARWLLICWDVIWNTEGRPWLLLWATFHTGATKIAKLDSARSCGKSFQTSNYWKSLATTQVKSRTRQR